MEAVMWWWSDYWPMPWVFGPLMMIVAIIFCGAMMFMMMRVMMGSHRSSSDDRHAFHILKERLARGEINQAEYEERRRLLEG
jgi:putative membrane protein